MNFLCLSLVLVFSILQGSHVHAHKKHRAFAHHTERPMSLGDGVKFPSRPLSRSAAERLMFGKKVYPIYRTSNPPFNATYPRDGEAVFVSTAAGMNFTWLARIDNVCVAGVFVYDCIPEEGNRAVYTSSDPFPTTGAGTTLSIFSSNPLDYVFYFICLDREREHVRGGRRIYCDAPWSVAFCTYEFPPNRVKWCAAEKDLYKALGISFDNEFNRYDPSELGRCPDK